MSLGPVKRVIGIQMEEEHAKKVTKRSG